MLGFRTKMGRVAAPSHERRHSLRLRLRVYARGLRRVLDRGEWRNSDVGLVVVAAALGVAVGCAVVAINDLVHLLHALAFGIPFEAHLSDRDSLDLTRVLVVPPLGGLIVGLGTWLIRRWRPHDIVDPVEANALYGGRMSLIDSLNLALLTILSSGSGASVGLEAALTQVGGGMASKLGRMLRLRRSDLRLMIGCGAAAAIAAAFNAPLTGAFYAFELVLGSYALTMLAPVTVAAVTGAVTARQVFGSDPIFVVGGPSGPDTHEYSLYVLTGLVAGLLAILVMKGVTAIEAWFRRRTLPIWIRPAAGGVALAALATPFPQVLGSGHGGIVNALNAAYPGPLLMTLLAAKAIASAISIGAGFRGGMFSSSLFLGGLLGGALAMSLNALPFVQLAVDPTTYSLIGMGAVAAGVVGAPVTMILLVLESTADFRAAIGVMVGVVVAAVAVRHWFGYSFATWRFHLRGMRIRSPHDIGWIEDLTARRLMRRDAHVVPDTLPLEALRQRFPLGSTKRVFVENADGDYGGMIDMTEAHSPDRAVADLTAGALAKGARRFLLPQYNIRTVLSLFADGQEETLAVVADERGCHVVGFVTEAYALRRYNQELERQHADELGSSELYGPAQAGD